MMNNWAQIDNEKERKELWYIWTSSALTELEFLREIIQNPIDKLAQQDVQDWARQAGHYQNQLSELILRTKKYLDNFTPKPRA
jgi:hypothetical protein